MTIESSSLLDLLDIFQDEQTCIDHLRAVRWRDGEFCPHCGGTRIYYFSDRKTFKCGECRQRFSIKVGTIFEDTKLPLRKWFVAIWMITNHPKGIASTTLAKNLNITQKSAWFILHRLRHATHTKSFNASLKGTIEADTTFVGGKGKNKHATNRKGGTQGGAEKSVVLGMIERDGELRATQVLDSKGTTLKGEDIARVESVSNLIADEDRSFRVLERHFYHHTVKHSVGEHIRRHIQHTNCIESIWAILKRQIIRVHHWVSPKHLGRYVQEMSWRFNLRDMNIVLHMSDLFSCVEGRPTYKEIIA